jgi:LmbE family N-acetylglucosaminyl deacetylase
MEHAASQESCGRSRTRRWSVSSARATKKRRPRAGRQPEVYFFEPHHPDSSEFVPDVYLDITSVHEIKAQAMAAIASQRFTPQVVDSL